MPQLVSEYQLVMPMLSKGIQILPTKEMILDAFQEQTEHKITAKLIYNKFNVHGDRVTLFMKRVPQYGMSEEELKTCQFRPYVLPKDLNREITLESISTVQWITNTAGGGL